MSRLRSFPPWLWAPTVLVTDFLSKRLVLAHDEVLRGGVRVIGDLLRFGYVRNPGAAMGLFHGGRPILIGVSILTSGLLVWLYLRGASAGRARRAALAAILGGALGNLVDRIFYGGRVVDFIDIGLGPHRFYTFNVADMGVTLGGAALFLAMLAQGRAQRRAREPMVGTAPDSPRPDESVAVAALPVQADANGSTTVDAPASSPAADGHV